MSGERHRRRKPNIPPEKSPTTPAKTNRSWTTSTVLSLVIGVVGALGVLELRPQLAVAPQPQLSTGQPFSSPFEISNTGYLSIHIEDIIVSFRIVEYSAGISGNGSAMGDANWDNFELSRGESKTILPYFSGGQQPPKADIVIAVDYRFFGIKQRWLFRFEGAFINNWLWTKQPIGQLEAEINQSVDDALAKHRRAIQNTRQPN
jgi:hypothetical protein